MYHLEFLTSTELVEGCAPWEWGPENLERVPEECFANKQARTLWINNPRTKWHIYSMYEGVNKRQRITQGGTTGEDLNPPLIQPFVAADCDVFISLEEAKKYAAAMKRPPTWFEQTLSGHGRFLWLFEKPIMHASRKICKAFMKDIGKLIEISKLPGLDEGALEDPARNFTNGARWTRLSDSVIPDDELKGFLMGVLNGVDWTSREYGRAVSLDAVWEECKKRYPRTADWPGNFEIGAQGPSFWIEGSASPTSAIVKPTGMYTFSAHATKPFYPWAELVGKQFVEQTANKQMGSAVSNIYYDGQKYFYQDQGGRWFDANLDSLRRFLHVSHGLSTKSKPTEPSEIDRALNHISMQNRISYAQSCAFYKKGLINYNGELVLNTHSRDVIRNNGILTPWGNDGGFAVMSAFLQHYFTTPEQLPFFLARWQRLYRGCLNLRPEQGQGIILCGPTGKGKTALVRGLVGRSVGGFCEAGPYFTKQTSFNVELFNVACWVIDDGTSLSSDMVHTIFSEKMKQGIANPEHHVSEKYRKGGMVPWEHLICLTCNEDPESLRAIPNLNISSRDKLLIFRVSADSPFKFDAKPVMEDIFAKELPYFLEWLLKYEPPPFVMKGAESRYGIASYCEPSLLRAANQSAPVNGFAELLTKWLREEFFNENRGAAFWEGTATDLLVAMSQNLIFQDLLRRYKMQDINRFLAQVQSKGMLKITIEDNEHERIWKIARDERFKKATVSAPPQAENSKFEKTQ